MKPCPFRYPRRRWLRVAGLLTLAIVPLAFGQPASPPAAGNSGRALDPRNDLAGIRAKQEEARSFARSNNRAQAEKSLTDYNLSSPGSASWSLETAQKLVQLAEEMSRSGRPAVAAGLARDALQHAVRATQLAQTLEAALGAKMLAGFIHERFLADRAGALAAFRDAAQLAPSSTAAREAHERAKKTDEAFREKQNQGGGR